MRVILYVAGNIDVSVTHAYPLYGRTLRHSPDGCVPNVAGEHVRGKRLQRQVRIFNGPQGVPGIETGTDEIRSCLLNQHLEFAALHMAGVVLNSDLKVEV